MRARDDTRKDQPLHRAGGVYQRTPGNRPYLERNALRQLVGGYGHWILAVLLAIFLAVTLDPGNAERQAGPADISTTPIADELDPVERESGRVDAAAATERAAQDQFGESVTAPDEHDLNEAQRVEGTTETVSVVVDPGPNGGYFLRGMINQQEVVFVVDTGASWIVVPERLKTRLKLVRGRYVQVATAGGVIGNYETKIGSLAIGPMQFQNVAGVLNPHAPNDLVLLGMSALKEIQIEQSAGRLTLTQQRSSVAREEEGMPPMPYRESRRPLRDCSTPGQVIDRRTLECMEGR